MQAVHTSKVAIGYLIKSISDVCSLNEVDVHAVLIALAIKLDYFLQLSRIVDLDDVGKFKMGFKSIAKENPTKLTTIRNIKKHHVNCQPSIKLKRKLKASITTYKEASRSI